MIDFGLREETGDILADASILRDRFAKPCGASIDAVDASARGFAEAKGFQGIGKRWISAARLGGKQILLLQASDQGAGV